MHRNWRLDGFIRAARYLYKGRAANAAPPTVNPVTPTRKILNAGIFVYLVQSRRLA